MLTASTVNDVKFWFKVTIKDFYLRSCVFPNANYALLSVKCCVLQFAKSDSVFAVLCALRLKFHYDLQCAKQPLKVQVTRHDMICVSRKKHGTI